MDVVCVCIDMKPVREIYENTRAASLIIAKST